MICSNAISLQTVMKISMKIASKINVQIPYFYQSMKAPFNIITCVYYILAQCNLTVVLNQISTDIFQALIFIKQ